MPQKVLKFAGINRSISGFLNSGACEELINLRPEVGGGYSVVKHKLSVEQEIDYDKFFEHVWGEHYNRIIVRNGAVYWMKADGSEVEITNEFLSLDISVSYAGNILVVYCEEEKRQQVFRFENGAYVPYNVSIKPIKKAEISYKYNATNTATNTVEYEAGGINEALYKAASGFHNKYKHGLCGAAVVGCTYELEDGNEMWSTAFIVANAARENGYRKPTYSSDAKNVSVFGASKVSLRLEFDSTKPEGIRKINIYATRPVFPYEFETVEGGGFILNEQTLEETNLDGQPMYYQGSVTIPEAGNISFDLSFGTEQAGETVMDVTSGCIERVGNTVSYNNRFHFFRSEVQHVIQQPTISDTGSTRESLSVWVAYVKFNDTWKLIDRLYRFSETAPNDFIYPMAGIKSIAFVKATEDSRGNITVPFNDMFKVTMRDSSAYNYSYAFDVTPTLTLVGGAWEDEMGETGQIWGRPLDSHVFWKNESNVINVSAPYNPFVFPVENSYGFSGEIIDVATSYLPVSAVQYGQYPLSVFTKNGVFALEQGNGKVLYSNVVPLQPYILDGKATTTPFGTFFVSGRALYLLSGRDAVCVSHALDGKLELDIRDLDSYKRLCFNTGGGFIDFSPLLSKKEFEELVSDASLSFDQMHNELYISSNDNSIKYSYVFNLDTKQFHKVSWKYSQTQNGSRYSIGIIGDSKDLVDLSRELDSSQTVLLQSRPMTLEMMFTHIQRILLPVESDLTGTQHMCLSIFASDNRKDWKCIISSQKRSVALRHIRTNRAAKSYRDYVILISGYVSTNTDISDLIADYTVVQRRLG